MKTEQLSRLEQQERESGLRIGRCGGPETSTKKLLNPGPMVTRLAAPTKRQIYAMNPTGVDDGEGLCARLRVRTLIGRVVTELQEVTGFSERGTLKI